MYRKKHGGGLMQVALTIPERLEQDIARFAERGISPEYPARLRATAMAFKTVILERGLELGRRASATKGMEAEMSLGYASMRNLNTLLRPTLERSPDLLAQWEM
ncbi:MAG: hypothetical protein IPF98_09595 [Gemmatimonadetes bacterium]|nr:hypothetical protein [Gemmatimonadota bacterium]MCC6770399.1 hypothetical protein [Gemmatimonadaceae bacterium]